MKIEANHDDGTLTLSEIYNGAAIKTDAGEFRFCQRDSGLEIRLGDGPWFSWQDEHGPEQLGVDDDKTRCVAREIEAERRRQVEVEGWSPEHDDEHEYGELSKAAACYAVEGTDAKVVDSTAEGERGFPWSIGDRRRKHTNRRLLIIAGAMILAEVERVDRAEMRAAKNGASDEE